MTPPLTTKITGGNNHCSLISLNINGLNSLIKRHTQQTRYVIGTQHFAAYRKYTSVTKTDTNSKEKPGKFFSKQMVPRNKM
jgi:hypothetical protein